MMPSETLSVFQLTKAFRRRILLQLEKTVKTIPDFTLGG